MGNQHLVSFACFFFSPPHRKMPEKNLLLLFTGRCFASKDMDIITNKASKIRNNGHIWKCTPKRSNNCHSIYSIYSLQ